MPDLDYLMSSEVDLNQFVGRWVAVVGREIIATGDTARDVYERARKEFPDEEPFLTKLPKEKVMLL